MESQNDPWRLADLDLAGRRVLVRADLDAQFGENALPEERFRAERAAQTVKQLLEAEAKPVLIAHLGRPRTGRRKGYSLEAAGLLIAELAGCEVLLPDDPIGDSARKAIEDLREKQIVLLENVRFDGGEEAKSEPFARELATLGDAYLGDSFDALYLDHASTTLLPRMFTRRGLGPNAAVELDALVGRIRGGGAGLAVVSAPLFSELSPLLDALLGRVRTLCVAGGAGNTLLAAAGVDVAASKHEADQLTVARAFADRAKARDVRLLLPTDACIAESAAADRFQHAGVRGLTASDMLLDLGPETVSRWAAEAATASDVFWLGPLGHFDNPVFAQGSLSFAQALAENGAAARTLVAGGRAARAVRRAAVDSAYALVASSERTVVTALEGKRLYGLEALRHN